MTADALIFAKYPAPGTVKTRLSPPLSPQEASEVHRAALAATCELVGLVSGVRTVLVGTPDNACEVMSQELGTLISETWTQGDGSLGTRLQRASERSFARGATRVVMFGADSPTLPVDVIAGAWTALNDADAVVGPCYDGGYYLLGLRAPQSALFQDIEWGTDRVLDQTRRRARASDLVLKELTPWYDIDRIDDLERAADDLQDVPGKTMRQRLQQTIDRILDRVEGND